MKKQFLLPIVILLSAILYCSTGKAQNTFPASGRAGVGTLSPTSDFQVRGITKLGGQPDFAKIDSNGNLSFGGTASYLVGGNHYVFQFASNPNFGLFLSNTYKRYEFRNNYGNSVFSISVYTGDGEIKGGMQVGNSINNVAGNIRWSGTDFEGYNGTTWLSLTNQELLSQVETLETENTVLQNEIANINLEIANLQSIQSTCCSLGVNTNNSSNESAHDKETLINQPTLAQNVPNPFTQNTTITYYLPNNTQNAQLVINSLSGSIMKVFTLSGTGIGQVTINGGEIPAGNYTYSLLINGNKVDSKQMTLTK